MRPPFDWHTLHGMQNDARDATSPEWMTAGEVADLYGVHRNTIREWAHAGLIPSHRLPSGRLRYRRDEIQALLDEASA